jgi:hypothetical protein
VSKRSDLLLHLEIYVSCVHKLLDVCSHSFGNEARHVGFASSVSKV